MLTWLMGPVKEVSGASSATLVRHHTFPRSTKCCYAAATGALNFEHAVDSYAQAHERVEVEDTVVATLRFENGALGRLNPRHY